MYLIHSPAPGEAWMRVAIPEHGAAIVPVGAGATELGAGPDPRAPALVLPFALHGGAAAALLVRAGSPDVRVDGQRPLSVCVLHERSELLVAGARLYFTARRPLEVARYTGDAACGVCGDPADGALAIACSACGAVAHEGALAEGGERACFSHRGACPGCQLPLEAFAWLPAEAP